jgi:hypothetical protein
MTKKCFKKCNNNNTDFGIMDHNKRIQNVSHAYLLAQTLGGQYFR